MAHSSLSSSPCSALEEMDLDHCTNEVSHPTSAARKDHNSRNTHHESLFSIFVRNYRFCRMEVPRLGQPWGWWLHQAQNGHDSRFSVRYQPREPEPGAGLSTHLGLQHVYDLSDHGYMSDHLKLYPFPATHTRCPGVPHCNDKGLWLNLFRFHQSSWKYEASLLQEVFESRGKFSAAHCLDGNDTALFETLGTNWLAASKYGFIVVREGSVLTYTAQKTA